ncbi:recombinase family protein [Leucobacter weissii]|uniref:Recombinase family protein n=1 Tax=Leucobacter weissii TaxID=1983706 RepID=A0A939MPA4_9MICO|nr:recombinase family protein [Leucobacter weissii]MBO1902242.1 recombinase family protein [Leucobacter weissii]
MSKKYGYVRASTLEQLNTLEIQHSELTDEGCHEIFVDRISGEKNIDSGDIDLEQEWNRMRAKIEPGDQVVVVSQSRLGRKSYEVLYAVGKLIEKGASLKVLEDGRIYDDLDNFEQNLNLAFHSVVDHNERVEIKRRTKKALNYLSANGIKLGRKPRLSNAHIAYIHQLRDQGLGYQAISKAVRVYSAKHRREQPISPTTVQKVLKGTYGPSLEEWEANNEKARTQMAKIAVAVKHIEAEERARA